MDKMKVVVFEIFPKTGKTLQEMLRTIPYVELIESEVNNTEEALALIFTQKPDVVILGNDFPGMDGFYFTKIVHKEAYPTQVILVAEVVSAESVRQAMRAGACDFISYKTLTAEELSKALELAGQIIEEANKTTNESQAPSELVSPQPSKTHARLPTRIITAYSPKGGTGVSTIIANLALSLSRRNNKVLVIDGDMMFGDMAVLLNQRSNYALTDLVKYKDCLDEDLIRMVINQGDVDLLSAPSNIEKSIGISDAFYEKILQTLAKLDYDYMLINTTSHLIDTTFVALEVADRVILVGTQEIPCLRALRLFMNLLATLSIAPEKLLLVINKFDKKSPLTFDKISNNLELEVCHSIPLDFSNVSHANNLGIPFILSDPELAISRSIEILADMIITHKPKNKITLSAINKGIKKIRKNFSGK